MKLHPYPDSDNAFLASHIELLTQSYLRFTGTLLLTETEQHKSLAEQLFTAPFALLSHTAQDDPILNYANKTALALFEMDWEQLIRTPSRFSAEVVNRVAREQLLARVTEFGFIDDYQGIRVSSTGKRFEISHAVVWNLLDEHDQYQGQAACFSDWRFLD